MTSLEKYQYESRLRDMADTTLYEEALRIIEDTLRYTCDTAEPCHKKNAMIYSEFWNRGKAKYYYKAFNLLNAKNSVDMVLNDPAPCKLN